MTKAKQFFEEELSGEPLTEEQVIWALEKFARLAWTDGYMSKYTEGWGGIANESVENFLSKSYSERDKEMVHI
jgi:hypothetical protein